MTSFEDYQVHREGLADAAEPDTWTRGPLPPDAREAADLTAKHLTADYPIPLVLTVDGKTAVQADDAPVPYALTPEGEAAAAEPDTWTGPVAYEFTRGNEVVAAGIMPREPEAGS